MAYSADTFVADEIPTTAKWNKLWNNDASFNDGTGIGSGVITFAKLLATIFSSQLSTYTNTGSGNGTGYYINLGGIKLCWGVTGSFSVPSPANYLISLPASFFSTVQLAKIEPYNPSITGLSYAANSSAPTASTLTTFIGNAGTTTALSWFVIGS